MAWLERSSVLKAANGPQGKGIVRLSVKSLVWLVGLAYFLTSAVVIVNAFVWLPTMPSAWYQMQRILYWPFQPYFALALRLLGKPSISYTMYATVAWAPFLLLSIALPIALLRRRGEKPNQPPL